MDNNRQDMQRGPHERTSPAGGGTIWFVVGLVLVILFAASLIRTPYRVDLPMSELKRLIAAGR